MAKKPTTPVSTTLVNALREAGLEPIHMWDVPGPKKTMVEWISAYHVDGGIVMVQTFKTGGWDAYTSIPSNDAAEAIADVTARCGAFSRKPAPEPMSQRDRDIAAIRGSALRN